MCISVGMCVGGHFPVEARGDTESSGTGTTGDCEMSDAKNQTQVPCKQSALGCWTISAHVCSNTHQSSFLKLNSVYALKQKQNLLFPCKESPTTAWDTEKSVFPAKQQKEW